MVNLRIRPCLGVYNFDSLPRSAAWEWMFLSKHRQAQQNQEPNPPKWPSSVHVFAPTDDMQKIQDIITAAYNGSRSMKRTIKK